MAGGSGKRWREIQFLSDIIAEAVPQFRGNNLSGNGKRWCRNATCVARDNVRQATTSKAGLKELERDVFL